MKFWSDTEIDLATKLKGQHRTITEIAAALGRSQASVQNFFRGRRKRTDYWKDAEIQILLREHEAGKTDSEIAAMLPGRTTDACHGKLDYLRQKRERVQIKTVGVFSFKVPEHLLAERDARSNEPRDLTAMLCGDPPFSQSALAARGLAGGQSKAEKAYETGP